jgi:hypothetical protein
MDLVYFIKDVRRACNITFHFMTGFKECRFDLNVLHENILEWFYPTYQQSQAEPLMSMIHSSIKTRH